jgi:hypothetical protein
VAPAFPEQIWPKRVAIGNDRQDAHRHPCSDAFHPALPAGQEDEWEPDKRDRCRPYAVAPTALLKLVGVHFKLATPPSEVPPPETRRDANRLRQRSRVRPDRTVSNRARARRLSARYAGEWAEDGLVPS